MTYFDPTTAKADRQAQDELEYRRSQHARLLHEMIKACQTAIETLDHKLRSLVSVAERVEADGNGCGITIVVNERVVRRDDGKKDLLTEHYSALSAIRELVINSAERARLRNFTYIAEDISGKKIHVMFIDQNGKLKKITN